MIQAYCKRIQAYEYSKRVRLNLKHGSPTRVPQGYFYAARGHICKLCVSTIKILE